MGDLSQQIDTILTALDGIASGMRTLNTLGVIRSRRFVSDYGEWLVTQIFGGTRADSKTQKGWDIELNGERIQVKTHSKAADNPNRWSSVSGAPEDFDSLAVVVLDESFWVKDVYKIPSDRLQEVMDRTTNKVMWSDLGPSSRISDLNLPKGVERLFVRK